MKYKSTLKRFYMKNRVMTLIMKYASLSNKLKTKDYKVLLYLLPELRKGETIRLNQARIAEDLNIAKSDVSRSIKALINEKVLRPEDYESGWKVDILLYPYYEEDIQERIDEILYGDEDEED